MNLIDEVKNDVAGLATIREMYGDHHAPVVQEQADRRAEICSTCPMNHVGNWWETAKSAMGETVKRHLEMKKNLELKTRFDDQIHNCKICGCVLKLKVWVHPETIKNHTESEMIPKFPAHCWLRIEQENL